MSVPACHFFWNGSRGSEPRRERDAWEQASLDCCKYETPKDHLESGYQAVVLQQVRADVGSGFRAAGPHRTGPMRMPDSIRRSFRKSTSERNLELMTNHPDAQAEPYTLPPEGSRIGLFDLFDQVA